VAHLAPARARAEVTTAKLMSGIYEQSLTPAERGEFAALVAELKTAVV
jgi:hypothetical protein